MSCVLCLLELEAALLKELDPQLYTHLVTDSMESFTFCHRQICTDLQYHYIFLFSISKEGFICVVIPHPHFICMCLPLRWLLLGFQREFEHSDALRLFEILSCDHLELISQQVDRARYQERLTRKCSTGDIKNACWQNK